MSLHEGFSREWALRKSPGIPAGLDAEAALFGMPGVSFREAHAAYMPFDRAIDFVKRHQPNPLERSRAVSQLRAHVAAICFDTKTPVKFFTAIGTPLDTYHGVDGFFEQGGRIATVDVSLREKEIAKAQVMLRARLDEDGKVSVAEEEMRQAAQRIADLLNKSANKIAA